MFSDAFAFSSSPESCCVMKGTRSGSTLAQANILVLPRMISSNRVGKIEIPTSQYLSYGTRIPRRIADTLSPTLAPSYKDIFQLHWF